MSDDIEAGNEPASSFFSDLWDDAGAEVTGRIDSPSAPEWNVLEEHDVSELMTRTPLATLGPDATAESAADVMRTKGIHRVLVTEDGKLVGIVSALDIATAAAERRFTNRKYVFNRSTDYDDRA